VVDAIHALACGGRIGTRRLAGGREALEQGGGTRLRAGLVEISRFGLEKVRSVKNNRSAKQSARMAGAGTKSTTVARIGGSAMEVELQQ
jgi:hypothetical protein